MAAITQAILKKQMETGSFSRVYMIYGSEKYLVSLYGGRLIEKWANTPFAQFNLQQFGGDAELSAVAAATDALPFMAPNRCVVFKDADAETLGAEKTKELKELIAGLPETTVLVLFYPTLDFDPRRSAKFRTLLGVVNQYGDTLQLDKQSDPELEKLLCAFAAKRKCTLSRQDAGRIVRSAGNNLRLLYSEMEKLCAYCGAQGTISAQMIDLLVTKNMEVTVFDLSKAIVSADYDRAYRLLDGLFYGGEEPVSVLAVLSGAFIDMYRVKVSVESGKSAEYPATYADYKGKEFRLRNAQRDCRELSVDVLRECLEQLLQADVQLKSARTDSRVILDELLARLLLITKRRNMS